MTFAIQNTAPSIFPVSYSQTRTQWQHRAIQWIDDYFQLCGIDNQPLWLTALKVLSYVTLIIPTVLLCTHCILRGMHPFTPSEPVAVKTDTIARQVIVSELEKPAPQIEKNLISDAETTVVEPEKPAIPDLLKQNKRIEANQIIYINPSLLFPGLQLEDEEIEINFAQVLCDGDLHVIPVQRPYKKGVEEINEYTRYHETALAALLKMAQNTKKDSPIKRILQHPHNHLLTVEEFFNFLMQRTPMKRHVETISITSLEEILELTLDQIAVSHEDLAFIFKKFAGSGKTKVMKMLLDEDLGLLAYHNKKGQAFFVDAVLNGHREEAEVHWQALQNAEKTFPHYRWLYKAMINDRNFTKQEFQAAAPEWRKDMFQAANVYQHSLMIDQLREYGVAPLDFFYPLYQRIDTIGVDYFSIAFDARNVSEALFNLMIIWNLDGALVTKQQFDKLDHNHFLLSSKPLSTFYVNNKILWINKVSKLDPIIKVPKMIAVIKPTHPDATSVVFKVKGMCPTSEDFEIYEEIITPVVFKVKGMCPTSEDFEIYEEIITPIERKATKDEMKALLSLIDETEFHGIPSEHFLLGKNTKGEEGIYFINTDYEHFERLDFSVEEDQVPTVKCVDYDKMGSLADLMAPENHAWLQEEIGRHRKIIAAKEQHRAEIQDTEYRYGMAIKHGYGVERNFEVRIKRIFNDYR